MSIPIQIMLYVICTIVVICIIGVIGHYKSTVNNLKYKLDCEEYDHRKCKVKLVCSERELNSYILQLMTREIEIDEKVREVAEINKQLRIEIDKLKKNETYAKQTIDYLQQQKRDHLLKMRAVNSISKNI